MAYDKDADSGDHSIKSTLLKSKLDRLESTLHSVDVSQNRFADYLLSFAASESWIHVSLDEIIRNRVSIQSKNIYADEVFVNTTDPNLIFDKIRPMLSANSYFAFKLVTAENLKINVQEKHASAFLVYYSVHFLFKRLLPKLRGFKHLYKFFSIRADISKAEIIGRSVYKGFVIVDLLETKDETTIITQLDASYNPDVRKNLPSTGLFLRMNRLGQNGKKIVVYKFRSMHPYAEYAQAYLHKKNGLDKGGKFKNDFRISRGGRLIRKYWIDELPMIYNLLKGDIKIIGVRPLSEHYFSLYPESVQALRRKYKPGLIPPFYADMPGTFDEIVQSEVTYLSQYEIAPLKTDFNYFLKILNNIIFRKARSK